jgi:hypothetical protein
MCILFRDVSLRIDEQDHDVGVLDRLQRLMTENFSMTSVTLRACAPAVSMSV